jgi:hypothetical protein
MIKQDRFRSQAIISFYKSHYSNYFVTSSRSPPLSLIPRQTNRETSDYCSKKLKWNFGIEHKTWMRSNKKNAELLIFFKGLKSCILHSQLKNYFVSSNNNNFSRIITLVTSELVWRMIPFFLFKVVIPVREIATNWVMMSKKS